MAGVKRCQSYLVASTSDVSIKRQLSEFANPPNKLETLGGKNCVAQGHAIQIDCSKSLTVFG